MWFLLEADGFCIVYRGILLEYTAHGANPIFFNKKIKIGRPKHSVTLHPLRPITSHFFDLFPCQSGRHMCITPYQILILRFMLLLLC